MDSVTLDIPPSETSNTVDTEACRRTAFIQSLRDCAEWLEQHPAVRAPRYITMNVFTESREDIIAHARAATWEKVYNGDWFYLKHEFGPDLSLDITTSRDTVCRKVVIGTEVVPAQPEHEREIVEWVCDDAALLARGA